MRLPIPRNPEALLRHVTSSPWVLGVVVSTAALGLAMIVAGDSPVRQPVALWFLFTCPGMAFIPLLGIDDGVFEWTLIVTVSLAIDAIVGVVMLYAGVWSPGAGLVILMGLALLGASIQSRQIERRYGVEER
jgi:hypothetical protein